MISEKTEKEAQRDREAKAKAKAKEEETIEREEADMRSLRKIRK